MSHAVIDAEGGAAGLARPVNEVEQGQARGELERALDEAKKLVNELRAFIDAIPVLAWCSFPDGSNDFVNRSWCLFTGLAPEQARGWGWKAAIHADDLEALLYKWAELRVSGGPGEMEARLRRHDGEYRWFLFRVEALRDESGNIGRWYGTNTDIEDLKRTEAKLREDEREFRRTTDAIAQTIMVQDPSGVPLYANKATLDYTGLTIDDVVSSNFRARIFHPEDLERLREGRQAALLRGLPFEIEQRALRKDGQYRWFLIRYNPLLDESGKVIRWYATGTDIEERKQAENKLRQDERELRQLIDFLPQHVVVLDKDGFLLQANKTVLDYNGYTLEEMQGRGTAARIKRDLHPDDLERVQGERSAGLSKGVPFEIEKRMLGKDGLYRWFLFRYKPVVSEDGQIVRWFATATDIEERKHAEDRMRNETVALREDIVRSSMYEEIIGSSAPLRKVLAQVERVAPTDSTVLIFGETGTGKELIARAIHNRSKRAARAFIRVNCGAIQPSLIGSELFGHEKGSFTGAVQRRLGRFEAADGGTIFLDEVGELPGEAQIALLRVLQEREFERVGGNQTVSVDVRVLAATNSELSQAVAEGKFRQDLFYRLNVFPLRIPALRERIDDIPLLAKYLIDRYAQNTGKRIRNVDNKTLELLQGYDWPGNVRELQNVIERAMILCDGETFRVDETWLAPASVQSGQREAPFLSDLAEREKELIETALRDTGGLVSGPNGAAARLHIPRQTLESKIKKLGIDRYRFKSS